ncbi:hypothetical protein POM88_050555 [Heracleum sosnowskyi]|uniref:Uncharacterized protein n=1 Tax=Heracleum sosnowskyi TaxID=360622 RepID=A0AAD8H036_9APIA|nr:hypothetical protein POM88_050555 [Heracleum sosnowskyi]
MSLLRIFYLTKSQVSNKIRRLKKKYVNNFIKVKGGKDSVISRPLKKIWESQVNGDSKVKNNRNKMDYKGDNAGSKTPAKSVETEKTVKNFIGLRTPKEYVKKVFSGLNKDKAREVEHEWNDFIVMEHQVYA